MIKIRMPKFLLAICLTFSTPALAIEVSDFSDMVGWTIAAVTSVQGEFDGCDFDRKIKFSNDWVLVCKSNSNANLLQPEAVIFTKEFKHQGNTYWVIKALINDKLYDMEFIVEK